MPFGERETVVVEEQAQGPGMLECDFGLPLQPRGMAVERYLEWVAALP